MMTDAEAVRRLSEWFRDADTRYVEAIRHIERRLALLEKVAKAERGIDEATIGDVTLTLKRATWNEIRGETDGDGE